MRRDIYLAVIIFGLLAAAILVFPETAPRAVGVSSFTCNIVVTGETRASLEDCG